MLAWLKEKAVLKVKDYINDNYMDSIGNIQDLSINDDDKSISAKVNLLGDKEPVEIVMNKYEIKDNKLIIKEITIDRKWMNTVANSFLTGKEFNLPTGASLLL